MEADAATLILVNHNSGYKNACVQHEINGEPYLDPMIALGRKCVHLRNNKEKIACLMSEFSENGRVPDFKNDAMSKFAKIGSHETWLFVNKRNRYKFT